MQKTLKQLMDLRYKRLWLGLSVLLLAGLSLSVYGQLIHSYFATDEWWAFSYAIATRSWREALAPAPSGVYTPMANLFIGWLYHTFGVNATVWATLDLTFHLASTLLAYWLVSRLTQNHFIGWLAAALFTFLPQGSQFIHQFSLMPTSGSASLLAMAALVLYSYQSWRTTLAAAILLFIGLLFSPYVAPFVFFALLIEAVFLTRKTWWQSILHYLPIGLIFAYYLYLQKKTSLVATGLHDRPLGAGDHGLTERLHSIGQKVYQGWGELLAQHKGTIDQHLMVHYSTQFLIISLILIAIVVWRRQYLLAKTALLGLFWIPASLTLFSTLNTVVVDATFPSRYFYMSTLGLGILTGSLVVGLFTWPKRPLLAPGLLAVALVAILINYWPITHTIVRDEVNLGQTRKMIMDTIVQAVPPPLGRDGLFCFTSNTGHYAVGRDQIPMPFIHNFGFNLAVTYRAAEPKLRDFFTENGYFLNPTASFYYFSRDQKDPNGLGPGIGFATNMTQCHALKEKFTLNLRLEDVYGFKYDGEKPGLTDVTADVRRYLNGDQAALANLYP